MACWPLLLSRESRSEQGRQGPWAVRTSLLAGWRGLYPGVCRAIAATGALLAPPGGFEGLCVVKEVLDPDDLPISEGEDGSQVGTQVDTAGPPVPPQSARTTTRSLTGKTRRRSKRCGPSSRRRSGPEAGTRRPRAPSRGSSG